jgi:hypothetical protein
MIRDMTKETTLAILEMIQKDLTEDIAAIEKAWDMKWNPAKIAGFGEESLRVTLMKINRLIEGNK